MQKWIFFSLIGNALIFSSSLFSCTVMLITKGASKTGSVIIAHTDDSNIEDDKRIVYVPALDHAPGSKRKISYTICGFPRYNGQDRGVNYELLKTYPLTPV